MQNIQAIILAAGKSTRFNTGKSKLVEKICGQEMILYPTKLLEQLHIPAIIVVGFQKEAVIDTIQKNHQQTVFEFVTQETQNGTGHAVQITQKLWSATHILIINGDVPLVTPHIIQELYETHQRTHAAISFVTAHCPDTSLGYGRVVEQNGKKQIIEAKDFSLDPEEYCCINAGIYLVRRDFLETFIHTLDTHNAKKELYLTDLVARASEQGLTVNTITAAFDTIRGINNFKELWAAEQVKRAEIISNWMHNGVRFALAQTTHVDLDVSIGSNTTIGTGVQLYAGTRIGKDCIIGDYAIIARSSINDKVTVHPFTVISDSQVETGAQVGPFAHIRNHSTIGSNSVIGNFVETKKTSIGNHTKAKHLSYLGDAKIGDNVNIGAGTITCNHNGVKKNTTIIHDGAYIGTNNSLVAPVIIGKDAYTAAGSTITEHVPAEALAIGRSRQVNKEGYAKKLRARAQQENQQHQPFIAAIKTAEETT